jgi:hypothetical protein
MTVSLSRHDWKREGKRTDACESRCKLTDWKQRNQKFEIYNQKVEILKNLIGRLATAQSEFYCDIR